MRKRWLGIGLGLFVIGILVSIVLFWKRPDSKSLNSQSGSAEGIGVIDLSQVKAIELVNAEGRVKFIINEENRWEIIEPKREVPDPLFFGGMIDVLSQLTRIRSVSQAEKGNLHQYGLEPALATLKFEFKDKREKKVLRIGNPNPTMSALFAWYEDEPDIFLLQPKIRMFVVMGFNKFRWRKMINLKAEEAQEFKIVVLDPALRKQLLVPETRTTVKQMTSYGPIWFFLDSQGSRDDAGQTEGILRWLEQASISDQIIDISPSELKKWGLDPPRAYFEISFPDRKEKILVGKENGDWIYLMQESYLVVRGYRKKNILDFLGADFRVHKVLFGEQFNDLNQIEVIFPEGKSYKLVKLDQDFWSINGAPQKKFPAFRTLWVTEPFMVLDYQELIRERPIAFSKYGLEKPRAKLKFYSGEKKLLELWVGKWDTQKYRCYIYLPEEDILSWYNEDVMSGIPPEASIFLKEEKDQPEGGGK